MEWLRQQQALKDRHQWWARWLVYQTRYASPLHAINTFAHTHTHLPTQPTAGREEVLHLALQGQALQPPLDPVEGAVGVGGLQLLELKTAVAGGGGSLLSFVTMIATFDHVRGIVTGLVL